MFGLAGLLFASAPQAMTFAEVSMTCPIGGERFKQRLAMSGSAFNTYLDTRPFGPAPAPWPLAKCPGNGFVIFTEKLTAEQRRILTPFVRSAEYGALLKTETNYALAAHLMSKVHSGARDIAYALVQASWEAKDKIQEARYWDAALQHYRLALQRPYGKPGEWAVDQAIAGELERRLSRFGSARERFTALLADARAQDEDLVRVIKYQLDLISARDAAPHLAPDRPPKQDSQ